MQRLKYLKCCKDAADAWGLPLDSRMRGEVQQLLAEALLPPGEHDAEFVDAAQLLRERGHSEAQVCRLAGELGKDLKLAAGGAGHQSAQRFGADDKNIARYHKTRDACMIATVLHSFTQRELYHNVMSSSPILDPRITQLLEREGRGRKRGPSAWTASGSCGSGP
jgi:hypothetical protein